MAIRNGNAHGGSTQKHGDKPRLPSEDWAEQAECWVNPTPELSDPRGRLTVVHVEQIKEVPTAQRPPPPEEQADEGRSFSFPTLVASDGVPTKQADKVRRMQELCVAILETLHSEPTKDLPPPPKDPGDPEVIIWQHEYDVAVGHTLRMAKGRVFQGWGETPPGENPPSEQTVWYQEYMAKRRDREP